MKVTDYKAMLRAVENALEICRGSSGFMDEMHRKICEDLRDARERLRRLIEGPELKS
jgi:hypothetical protein